jgi:Polyketide cyclase / dehydrase and lipid transport
MESVFTFKALLVVALIMVGVSAVLLRKKVFSITSSVAVNANTSEVFNVLKDLNRFTQWSPFLVADPRQKNHVTGQSGEIGSTFHWEGVAEKSKGYQVLAAMEQRQYLRFECTMEAPFKSNPVFEYRLQEKDGQVVVVQDFSVNLNGFSSLMMSLFGVKKEMATTNHLGLERLKKLVEGA